MKYTVIPPKLAWARIANNAIHQYHTGQWTGRVTGDQEFVQFSVVHPHIRAARPWAAARTPHKTTEASTAVRTSLQTLWSDGYRHNIHAGAPLSKSAHKLTLLRECHILPDTNPYDKVTLLLSAVNSLNERQSDVYILLLI
ncbi:hypothetical protein DPMN_012382 [Dreissena polymorpha]|uniref:Uncharacterized protein n=1 Tax=Dreissena polymorpha TaxID=45954 RepID=A0A9D4N6X6_DREPO|nr:hypothetical protein DPMN_012382 [Dreissena polymorpha]